MVSFSQCPVGSTRPSRRPASPRSAAPLRTAITRLIALVVVACGIAGLSASPAAAAPQANELEYTRHAEREASRQPNGELLFRLAILHPGAGRLLTHERLAQQDAMNYYGSVGYDRNFMVWAPIRQISPEEMGTRNFSGCRAGHDAGTFCNPGRGSVRWMYGPRHDWNGPTTAKAWGSGFIALACGNFPEDGTQQGPVPKISGTKYEDVNGNGQRDAGEGAVGGVTIHLSRDGQQLASTTTDGNGRYAFALNANADARYTQGTYTVREDVPDGYRQTAAPGGTFVGLGVADHDFGGHDFGNRKVTDLSVEKTASKPITIAGERLSWSLTVRNLGRWAAPDTTITDTVPAELDQIDELDPACSLSGRTVTCSLGSLAAGGSRTVRFRSRAKPDLAKDLPVKNRACVSTSIPDTDAATDCDDDTTVIETRADLVAGKKASTWHVLGGGLVEYTLSVRNDGPSWARSVILKDELPGALEAIETDAPATCAIAGRVVTCAVGDLAPGATATVVVRARATGEPPAPPTPGEDDHLLGVDRAQRSVMIDPGPDPTTIDVPCPSAGIVTDGSVRIEHVDQGTGTKADVRVVGSFAAERSLYRAKIYNDTTGRVQVHAGAVCLRPTTVGGNGPAHDVLTDDRVDVERTLPVGRHTVRLEAGLDRHAVAPGYEVLSGRARLVSSEPTATGWELVYDVTQPAVVRSSIVPLHGRLQVVDGHTHRLPFTHPVRDITLSPGESVHTIMCEPNEKGITASWTGLVHLGDEAQPRSRVFRFLNQGTDPAPAKIDLLCLSDRTGPTLDPEGEVDNTVHATSATEDPGPGVNAATATIVIDRKRLDQTPPVPPTALGPGTLTAAPNAGTPPASSVGDLTTAPRDASTTGDAAGTPIPNGTATPSRSAAGTAWAAPASGARAAAVTLLGAPARSRDGRAAIVRFRCAAACVLTVEVRRKGRRVARSTVRRSSAGTARTRLALPAVARRTSALTVTVCDRRTGRALVTRRIRGV